MRTKISWLALFLALTALVALSGCNSEEQAQAKAAPPHMPKVDIITVKATPYNKIMELPGRISAVRSAEVRARVAGILITRDFEEGSFVEKGQVLFHIDPSQFLATQAQAKADLAKAEASMADYEATLNRYGPLLKAKVISQQDYDTAAANYKVAKAEKEAAEASVRTSTLDLSYATVEAPISGKIGAAYVTEGALVGKNEATALAKIQQLDPIYADINQPVAQYLQVRAAMNANKGAGREPEVSVHIDNVDYTEKGRLLFSDVSVDEKTGQVSLRCEFPNKDGMLLPGLFVRILITLPEEGTTIYVPQRAVAMSQASGSTLFVLDEQNTVQVRPVKTGEMRGDQWQIVDGLKSGERVIVNGANKVKPGMILDPGQPASDKVAEQ
ncbi:MULTISPECIES: efflux RND transporter periplasmic adaptor subunit [unclassified Pseudodesulfovibrio]|uniref:efflux RND transporter periplasmic adaptor subunit n=1 Tax=unclassified Pseudodesulfovibrio TaxID=2661612 RepID=UPI000FEB978E|nr:MULTISPECIES: efflux RND transporter periplasmic adaptor subunit [unclassified Pseudodesulfovibrio]MCJ2163411.1 efflux RND transporter periplasmic adaptor subunit [Pseudodesulfovibrio sp. S3-i]RWU06648.1 efflux RND transporter periplasmic adaptor subunit [Pseudodesulfovibrio sp. S3]